MLRLRTSWNHSLQMTKPRQVGASGLARFEVNSSRRGHVDRVLVQRTLDLEAHVSVHQGEQRVVLAHADVGAGMELGAALAHDDGTGADEFAAEGLDAQHLRLGIAPVSRGAAAFFLCHFSCSLAGNGTDLQFGVLLAMALVLLVMLAATHLEDAHLLVLAVRHDRGLHRGTRHQGDADLQVATVSESEHLVDRDFLADVRSNLFYLDLVAGSNTILLASGFYDRVHG